MNKRWIVVLTIVAFLLGTTVTDAATAISLYFNGAKKSVTVKTIDGVPYVPAENVATLFGGEYSYNKSTGKVDLTSMDYIAPGSAGSTKSNPAKLNTKAEYFVITRYPEKFEDPNSDPGNESTLYKFQAHSGTITIKKIVRGSAALDLLKKANQGSREYLTYLEFLNSEGEDYDYLLANVQVNVQEVIGNSSSATINFTEFGFNSTSTSDWYNRPLNPEYDIKAPSPQLNAKVNVNKSTEGWLLFLVPKKDLKPLITYGLSYEGINFGPPITWLKAY